MGTTLESGHQEAARPGIRCDAPPPNAGLHGDAAQCSYTRHSRRSPVRPLCRNQRERLDGEGEFAVGGKEARDAIPGKVYCGVRGIGVAVQQILSGSVLGKVLNPTGVSPPCADDSGTRPDRAPAMLVGPQVVTEIVVAGMRQLTIQAGQPRTTTILPVIAVVVGCR